MVFDNIIYKINIEKMHYGISDSALVISFSVLLNPSIRDNLIAATFLLDKFNKFFSNDEENSNMRQVIQSKLKLYNEPNSICTFLPLKENYQGKQVLYNIYMIKNILNSFLSNSQVIRRTKKNNNSNDSFNKYRNRRNY